MVGMGVTEVMAVGAMEGVVGTAGESLSADPLRRSMAGMAVGFR